MTKMERTEKYRVPQNKALEHAIVHLVLGVITKKLGLEKWKGATVNPEPLLIYDLNGQLLFYEFSVEIKGMVVGRIKASASKVLGPSVYTEEVGPRKWDPDKAREEVTKRIQKKYKGATIVSTRLVCYSYPKIGILAVLVEPKTKKEIGRVVADVATYRFVPKRMPEKRRLGVAMWSMYESIQQKDKLDRLSRWENDDKLVELLTKIAKGVRINIRAKLSDEELRRLEKILMGVQKKRLGWPSPDADIIGPFEILPMLLYKTIPIPLHGQEHECWCVPATAQMILRHHHYYYEQPAIAVTMRTIPQPQDVATWNPDAPDFDPCGTYYHYTALAPSDLEDGMESLSRNYLEAVVDDSPTLNKVMSEIDQDRPFFCMVPWHARACTGYGRLDFLYPTVAEVGIHFHAWISLWIKNPWPPNSNNTFCKPQGGDEGWEDWDVSSYLPFVYIRPCKGTMICQE
jgi:hypothetical protein